MPDTTDPAASALDEAVAEFLADVRMQAEDHRLVPAHMVFPLLAVADKVLAAHRDAGGRCAWCRNPDGQRAAFPCGEYLAVRAELLGEAGDGNTQ